MANEFGSQYALYQITITKMSGSDDSKTYWTYRRYSDFHDIDIRLREVLGESDFPLELPKKEKFDYNNDNGKVTFMKRFRKLLKDPVP